MSYPKQRINTELKELAKHFDLKVFSEVIIGKDEEGIQYIIAIIAPIAPTVASYIAMNHTFLLNSGKDTNQQLNKERFNVLLTISKNMKIYNEIIPKLVENGKKD